MEKGSLFLKLAKACDHASLHSQTHTKTRHTNNNNNNNKHARPILNRKKKFVVLLAATRAKAAEHSQRMRAGFYRGTNSGKYSQKAGGKTRGEIIYKRVQEVFERLFPEVWDTQMEIAQAIIRLMVRTVFREEIETHWEKLVRKYGFSLVDLVNILTIIAPRRSGKTAVSGKVLAAFIRAIPHFKHIHFSMDLDLAGDFISEISQSTLCDDAGPRDFEIKYNSRHVFMIKGNYDPKDLRESKCAAVHVNVSTFQKIIPSFTIKEAR